MPSDYDLISAGASTMYAAFVMKIVDTLRSKMSGVELTVHLGVYTALFSLDMNSQFITVDVLSAFTGLAVFRIEPILIMLKGIGAIQVVPNADAQSARGYELVADYDVMRDFISSRRADT